MEHTEEILRLIRERAREIWEYCKDFPLIVDDLGNVRLRTDQDNWLEAEREILANYKPRRLR